MVFRCTTINHKCKKQSFNANLELKYNKFRNYVSNEINKANIDYYTSCYSACKDKNNSKSNLNIELVKKKNSQNHTLSLQKCGGLKITDPVEFCNTFNNLFTKTGKNLANGLPVQPENLDFKYFLLS